LIKSQKELKLTLKKQNLSAIDVTKLVDLKELNLN
jgi:hypothetical protein